MELRTVYHTSATPPAAEPLDTALAPLDEVAREAAGVPLTITARERAYALLLLGAELAAGTNSTHLYEALRGLGVERAEALTIGRAFASAGQRLATWLEQSTR